MRWLKWLPWRYAVRRVARAHGFLDPIRLLAQVHRFAQPAEVAEPIELLRAGVVFHARGLINSRVIQHNLDWVWPYWAERQFDPGDDAFIPRAFSITHINLTNRNWTAIGWPDIADLPIVDPRGLLTPFFDGWSLDGWIVSDDGRRLLPSRTATAAQRLTFDSEPLVQTETDQDGLSLINRSTVQLENGAAVCKMALAGRSDSAGWLVVAIRPYNPEGISFIHDISLTPERTRWTIDGQRTVKFSAAAERHHISNYRAGDVHIHLFDLNDQNTGLCDVGMVTAAALFRLEPDQPREIELSIPLSFQPGAKNTRTPSWQENLDKACQLKLPDARIQFLYDAALRTLILHSPDDVYAGPYTYKRFWFRDAAFIIHALLCAGLLERAGRALDRFSLRQTRQGYFHSQEGEWDANGEVLWIMHRFCELSGSRPKPAWRQAIYRGAKWIVKKRLSDNRMDAHAGLLPAGFSAEHLGPSDYYYWDDFWGVAGLRAAAALAAALDDQSAAGAFEHETRKFMDAIERSLVKTQTRLGRRAMPASPHRRLDAGAIGSLAVGYPLQLWHGCDPRLLDSVDFLLENCFVDGGFFQDMIHSGLNPYLTLHVAQVLLRAGDTRALALLDTVAALASPTGQWPEAIHPRTGGGCMGDGQHVWAAAEWVLMLRNCFIREEGAGLILAAGVQPHWLSSGSTLRFGPAPTSFGTVTVTIDPGADGRCQVYWQGAWHKQAPSIEVRLPGFDFRIAKLGQTAIDMKRRCADEYRYAE